MTPEMFTALLQIIFFLGSKDTRTKEETLAYNQFLAYAGSLARYNRLAVDDEIELKLDGELHESTPNPSERTP